MNASTNPANKHESVNRNFIQQESRFDTAVILWGSRGILRIPHLQSFLPECGRVVLRSKLKQGECDAVVGWGHKETADRSRALAQKNNIPYLALEDGFLRSMAPGSSGAPALSIVMDDLGIYYDATSTSRLEQMLEVGGWETAELLERSRKALRLIIRERISKYNHAPLSERSLPGSRKEKVLVVDQTFGDCSVTFGKANADTFHSMLSAALEENPEADIVVKSHPDVLAGKKRGYLAHAEKRSPRVHVLNEELNPIALLEKVDRVYTVSSQMGFEALFLDKPVDCFGVPFYSGWGLTHDRQSVGRRTRRRTVEELFAAAYILYPRYINPFTGAPGSIEDVLDYLALQSHHQRDLQGKELFCDGIRWWKRSYLRKMLSAPGNKIHFSAPGGFQIKTSQVVVWGDGEHSAMVREAESSNTPVVRMEDGFLRSVGLGSNLVRPLSLVLDRSGIYFDPSRPSDLETIYLKTDFSEELLRRAESLHRRIVSERFSKYNVGTDSPIEPRVKPGQIVVFVPGQVEDDASIRLGCVDLCTNLELLSEVRRQNPGAYIIYKPHPDVLAGNRQGKVFNLAGGEYCDQIITEHAMPACLDISDEVHTLTSLAGFEALLHGKKVVCYGLPFYAGWGLTTDRHQLPRRGRALTLTELVAGALILYPRYIDWRTGDLIPVEVALDRLAEERAHNRAGKSIKAGVVGRWLKKLTGFFSAIR